MAKFPKNPSLTLVDASKPNPLAPPATLAEAGCNLWTSIQSEYRITDAGGIATLTQACAAADTIARCDQIIAQDGETIRTKAGLKEHPLLKVQLAARAFVVRSLARLNLDVETTGGGAGIGRLPPTRQ